MRKTRRTIFKLVCLAILWGNVSCSQAQNTEPLYTKVIPGDAVLKGSRLKPHRVTYKRSGKQMIYDMKLDNKWDKEVYELLVYFGGPDVVPDRMYLNLKDGSFAGRKLQMDAQGYTIDLKFENNHMTGSLQPHEGSKYEYREYDKMHPHGAFEPAVINYTISLLPLEEGYKASIPTMDLNNGSQIIWANISVEKHETLNIGGKTYDTWKVISEGIRKKTIWVSTTEPYFIKMKTKGNPGTWELSGN